MRDGDELTSLLDQVDAFSSDGSCDTASVTATRVLNQIDTLPDSVDPELRQRLIEGAQNLQTLVNDPAGCTPASSSSQFTPSTPLETNPSGKVKPTPPGHTTTSVGGGTPAPGTPAPDTPPASGGADTGGGATPPDATPTP